MGALHPAHTCSLFQKRQPCAKALGKGEQSPKGKQEVPNAHEHAALEHVSTVQQGRSCLRVTKRFHDRKLSALHSSKAVSLTLESLSLFPHLQNGPPNPPYLTKPSVFERHLNLKGKDFALSEDHKITVRPSSFRLPVRTME